MNESDAKPTLAAVPASERRERAPDAGAYRLLAVEPLAPAFAGIGRWRFAAGRDDADVLLVPASGRPHWLAGYRRQHPLTPVVVVGPPADGEEFHAPDHSTHALVPVLERIEPILAARDEIPPAVRERVAADSHLAVAAWLWTRGRRIAVAVSDRFPRGFGYPCEEAVAEAEVVLESLAAGGYLERRLAEAAHACPQCDGLYVLLRDTCRACGAIDIFEEPLVHHFVCATQGPESEFSTPAGDYVCPKCGKRLRHFGMDYDKPGTLMCCRQCGHQSHETEVRGRCVECGHRFDAAASRRRELYDYVLNDTGVHALFQGTMRLHDPLAFLGETLSLETPETFVAIAAKFAALESRHKLSTLFMEVDLEEAGEEVESLGSRIRLITLIGRELAGMLRPTDVVAYSVGSLWLLLPGSHLQVSDRIVSRLEAAIARTFAPEVAAKTRFHTRPVADWLHAAREA